MNNLCESELKKVKQPELSKTGSNRVNLIVDAKLEVLSPLAKRSKNAAVGDPAKQRRLSESLERISDEKESESQMDMQYEPGVVSTGL